MKTHADRRQYTRVQLCAYGIDKLCTALLGQERCTLELVDISEGGARLRLKSAGPVSAENHLVLSVQGVKDNGRLQNLTAHIRWRAGQELGVQFDPELGIAVSELQRLIS
ncbi:MAG: PilZ domain-containing protein [Humidesulfovibrio sp.]|nr:PilZ domain-containing protein [Humidesulfovibrio sp.]